MGKLRLVTDNYISESYLTCSPASTTSQNLVDGNYIRQDLTTLPISNIKKISKSLVFRSIDATTISINGIIRDNLPTNCMIFNGYNFTEGTVITVTFYSDVGFSNFIDTVTHTVLSHECTCFEVLTQNNIVLWFNEIPNVKSFRVQLTNSSVIPLEYFQLSKLIVGNYLETYINFSKGYSIEYAEDTKQYRTQAGTLASDYVSPRKILEFSLDTIQEKERAKIKRALVGVGLQKEFFISMFPETSNIEKEKDFSAVVKLKKIPVYTEFAPNLYRSSFEVEEI